MGKRWFAIALLAGSLLSGAMLNAVDMVDDAAFTPSDEAQAWLTSIVREAMPAEYEKSKNWGHTKKVLAGWKLEQDGLRIETRRRYKQANDGTWQKYSVRLVDPERSFQIRVENITQLPDGKVSFDLSADAQLDVFGRQSQWESGVQLYSLSVEADARVRLQAHVEVALKLDPTKLPPDVYVRPVVTSADLQIPDFRMRKVSHLHGPVVRSLSHTVREAVEDKLADDRTKIVAALNKQIAKNDAKLKFSAQELLQSKWGSLVGKSLDTK
jgi:hypothetical protein